MTHGQASTDLSGRRPAIGLRKEVRRWIPRLALPAGLGLRASERKLLLGVVDLLLLIAAVAIAIKVRTDWLDPPGSFIVLWRWWVTLAVVWWLAAQLLDCYDLARAASAPVSILSAAPAAGLTVLAYQAIPLFSPPLASRGLILIASALAVGGVALWRALYAVLFVQPSFEQRALVLGAGGAGLALLAALRAADGSGAANPYRGTGYRIAGFVDDDPAKRANPPAPDVIVLGASADLPRLAAELGVDEVVLAITNRSAISDEAFAALLECRERGFRVTTMPSLYERLLGRVPVQHAGRDLNAVLPIDEGGVTERLHLVIKRAGDIVWALLGLAPLGLALPFVALANALGSPGPLFFRQERVGRGGTTFRMFKLRTMRPDAEATSGAVWATTNDTRVTPVGRLLRRTRLDELPQLINVLAGEMSLIGPRPERPEFVDQLAHVIPFYRARHAVRPGITGWAQVRFGYGDSVEHARIKLEYDLYYVRHSGFYLDALIALKTAASVLRLQGR